MYFRATVIALVAFSIVLHLQTQVQLSFALHDRCHRTPSTVNRVPAPRPTPAAQPTPTRAAPPVLDPHRPTQLVDLRSEPAPSSQLMTSARWVPAYRDGQPLGAKIYAVSPGSSSATWGLRNGDTVLSVNGVRPLSDEFMALLGDPPDFWDLEIQRKGQRQRIVVLVHR